MITIDTASAVPPYEQVRSQLAGQINDVRVVVASDGFRTLLPADVLGPAQKS